MFDSSSQCSHRGRLGLYLSVLWSGQCLQVDSRAIMGLALCVSPPSGPQSCVAFQCLKIVLLLAYSGRISLELGMLSWRKQKLSSRCSDVLEFGKSQLPLLPSSYLLNIHLQAGWRVLQWGSWGRCPVCCGWDQDLRGTMSVYIKRLCPVGWSFLLKPLHLAGCRQPFYFPFLK